MRAHRPVVLVAALASVLVAASRASAAALTFHLSANEALASVARTNAFVAALGKRAKGVKLVPGGLTFAGQTCAAFGSVYQLGAVSVLDGPSALPALVTSRKGRGGAALEAVFRAAGVATWTPPPLAAELGLPFWSASPLPHGVRFAADALTHGGDSGLIGAAGSTGVVSFRIDVGSAPDADGRYRLLLELYGRTSSADDPSGLVAFAERRCYTFVDLEPVDVSALAGLVTARVTSSTLRSRLLNQLASVGVDLDRRDIAATLADLALFTTTVVSHSLDTLPPDRGRRLVAGAFNVRRGIVFSPVTAICGNGTRETGEQCDGTDLGSFTCTGLGFSSGTLACSGDCHFDTRGCVASPVCGNGVLEIGEECDRGAANSDTVPDACRTDCKRAHCDDGVIDSFEDCEGRNLNGETCITLGFDGGTLRCDECEFDDERCSEDF